LCSLDNLVGELLEMQRHVEAECFGGFEIDHQLVQKSTESQSRRPIPLPAEPLLSPQPEPSCEVESNADERQKLDYERQCYRHAEMIVRGRLQILQSSVDKTISAVKRGEGGGP
jgi:hypothetical protein